MQKVGGVVWTPQKTLWPQGTTHKISLPRGSGRERPPSSAGGDAKNKSRSSDDSLKWGGGRGRTRTTETLTQGKHGPTYLSKKTKQRENREEGRTWKSSEKKGLRPSDALVREGLRVKSLGGSSLRVSRERLGGAQRVVMTWSQGGLTQKKKKKNG